MLSQHRALLSSNTLAEIHIKNQTVYVVDIAACFLYSSVPGNPHCYDLLPALTGPLHPVSPEYIA
jgi:hypothetical protein